MDESKMREYLKLYKVQPVGDGFIDCITEWEYVREFLAFLNKNRIMITGVSWWFHHNKSNDSKYNYPFGMGGPKSLYFDGWFSEVPTLFCDDFTDNLQVYEYITVGIRNDRMYSPGLVPGFWLDVEAKN